MGSFFVVPVILRTLRHEMFMVLIQAERDL